MAAGKLNLKIEQGATFRQSLQWKTGDPATSVNLTGYQARMQIRSDVTSAVVLADMTTANGRILITDAVNGKFDLYLTAVETAALSFESGVYDLELVAPDNTVTRLLAGSVVLSPEVTR